MKKYDLCVLLVCLLFIFFVGLFGHHRHFERKIDNIVRISIHENNHYSFVVENNAGQMHIIDFGESLQHAVVKRIADVPFGEKMWAYAKGKHSFAAYGKKSNKNEMFDYLEIHIHPKKCSKNWLRPREDHGKFGRGQTNVVE